MSAASVVAVDPARLVATPLFAGLTDDQRDRVAAVSDEREVDEGTQLTREGDFGYALFAVETGTAEVLQNGTLLRRLGPGDVFGEIAVLASGRRTASVVASSPMRLITVLNRDLWRLEDDVPEVVAALRETLAHHLET